MFVTDIQWKITDFVLGWNGPLQYLCPDSLITDSSNTDKMPYKAPTKPRLQKMEDLEALGKVYNLRQEFSN